MPRSATTRNTSRSRPSRSAPSATYTVVTGIPARSASTTELRPATHSESPALVGRLARADEDFWARFSCLNALWPSRSFAFGVGPLPSSPRRRRPPEPAVGLPLPVFLIAPRRDELPAIRCPVLGWSSLRYGWSQRPLRALRSV